MKALLFTLLVGCAPRAMTTSAGHPANPNAPTGRLAGPPAALRPGVADVSTPTRDSSPAADHSGHGAAPQAPAQDHSGHEGHPSAAPEKTEPSKTDSATPEPTGPTKTEPAKKPAPKQPAKKPRKQVKPPASKKAPDPEPPKQPTPPAHQGHEGHEGHH